MADTLPHFLLFAGAHHAPGQHGWRFSLESADGEEVLNAADLEPGLGIEELEMLAVIRGLESLDQRSRVSLFTNSDYIRRGLRLGLPEWRENGWTWERFGRIRPIRYQRSWQRLDRALEFHQVRCRVWHFEMETDNEPSVALETSQGEPEPRWQLAASVKQPWNAASRWISDTFASPARPALAGNW